MTSDPQAGTVRRKRWWQARGGALTHMLWVGAAWWTFAFVLAGYAAVFLVDEAFSFGFSPVLPAVLALGVIWIVLPLGLAELAHRRWRNLEAGRQAAKVNRFIIGGRRATLAASLFAGWWFAFAL